MRINPTSPKRGLLACILVAVFAVVITVTEIVLLSAHNRTATECSNRTASPFR
jgi:hypothetical protein